MKLSVITPTGGRPEAFALCERWMSHQTVQPHEWIVVDDCDPPTLTTRGQFVVRPEPRWVPNAKYPTLGRNLLAGFECVTGDAVVIVEDDDYYSPGHLGMMATLLEHAPLVGEGLARYYNVVTRCWRDMANAGHASLASTAWRHTLTPHVSRIIERLGQPCYDLSIWRETSHNILSVTTHNVVGMKRMPGRKGIANGHADETCRNHDPDMTQLREWIGDDVTAYERLSA